MRILAIDSGNKESACVVLDVATHIEPWEIRGVLKAAKLKNDDMREYVLDQLHVYHNDIVTVIEKIQSFGMAVGAEVFETCYWIGRFWEVAGDPVAFVTRMEEKMCLCKNSRAKDKNIRQALLDRFGPVPTQKKPNPFYGDIKLSGDMWSALAVAVTYVERVNAE